MPSTISASSPLLKREQSAIPSASKFPGVSRLAPTPIPCAVLDDCIQSGYGTRLIPEGAITGAHFVQTPDYVQITGMFHPMSCATASLSLVAGVGDLTQLNVAPGDEGGELDPHGADGNGMILTFDFSPTDS